MNAAQMRTIDGQPRLSVFAPKNCMPMEEALRNADAARARLAPNKLLTASDHSAILGAFPCRTGTIFAYAPPGEKLGTHIRYFDSGDRALYSWLVPQKYMGARDIALVAEHPGVYVERGLGNSRTIRASTIDIIEAFPASDGWYLGDAVHGIPSGPSVPASTPGALHLWRMFDSMIGLVVRGYDHTNYPGRERLVNMGARPSDLLGAVSVDRE